MQLLRDDANKRNVEEKGKENDKEQLLSQLRDLQKKLDTQQVEQLAAISRSKSELAASHKSELESVEMSLAENQKSAAAKEKDLQDLLLKERKVSIGLHCRM